MPSEHLADLGENDRFQREAAPSAPAAGESARPWLHHFRGALALVEQKCKSFPSKPGVDRHLREISPSPGVVRRWDERGRSDG